MDLKKLRPIVLNKLKKELNPNLYYHNYQHTLDVCESVDRLAEIEEIKGEELVTLRTAALLHDTGFIWQYENNEEIACKYGMEILPDFDYSPGQIEHICAMIMATQIPQNPKDKLGMILCDADLDYIGRGDFFITALRLHREWSENSSQKITFKNWYIKQQNFILQHEYFTQGAKDLRNGTKQHNLSQIKELLNLLESTNTETADNLSGVLK